jgi:phosphoribosylanthranilate isomerase
MSGWIKICGLARAEDVRAAAELRPDFLGFVFWPGSPRAVRPEQVAAWTRELRGGPVRTVGVFVDAAAEEVNAAADLAGLDRIQLHGRGDAAFARSLCRPVWRTVHLDRLPEGLAGYPAEALLVDSGTVEMPGGTGARVDTARAAAFVRAQNTKVLLAGGLKADTVGEAIRRVRPFGVDVSSGVEAAPGIKNPDAVRRFIEAARAAFASLSPVNPS